MKITNLIPLRADSVAEPVEACLPVPIKVGFNPPLFMTCDLFPSAMIYFSSQSLILTK